MTDVAIAVTNLSLDYGRLRVIDDLSLEVTIASGTTAEALLQLEKGEFTDLLNQAIKAAHDKAKRFGGF